MTAGPPRTPPVTDDEAGPSDNTTLMSVLASYEQAGFTGQFGATDEGLLECFSCNTTMEPSAASLDSLRRMEGASDPADMLAVLAITCPNCSTQGTVVVHYGPEAEPGESRVLMTLEDRRLVGDMPDGIAPTENQTQG